MLFRLAVVFVFFLMISINAAANIVPINGVTTGGVSDSYPNLFAPAGVTFSIWGVIYLLLAAYTLAQWHFPNTPKQNHAVALAIRQINPWFFASSLLNSAWIFSWHYRMIGLSVTLMLGLLICLIRIAEVTRSINLQGWHNLLVVTPFSVYFGWITVATIANITTWLVSFGWNGGGLPDVFWMLLALVAGAMIGVWRLLRDRRISYGLVLTWAYAGIVLKHVSGQGFAWRYPAVVITAGFLIAVFVAAIASVGYLRKKPA